MHSKHVIILFLSSILSLATVSSRAKERFYVELGLGPQVTHFEPAHGALRAPRTWGYDFRVAFEWAPLLHWIRFGIGEGITTTGEMAFADSQYQWTEFYFHIHSPAHIVLLRNLFVHIGTRWTQIYSIDALYDEAGWRSSWLPFGGIGFSTKFIYGRFSVLYSITGGHFVNRFRRFRFEKGAISFLYEISI